MLFTVVIFRSGFEEMEKILEKGREERYGWECGLQLMG
jgi:hypothetical protein